MAWLEAPNCFLCSLSLPGGDGCERKTRVDDPIRSGRFLSLSGVVELISLSNRPVGAIQSAIAVGVVTGVVAVVYNFRIRFT